MATYSKSSPWYATPQNSLYLEPLVYRTIPITKDDVKYTIENQYRHRPDLLAYDRYGDPKLWWVFIVRNRSLIKDPIFDFVPGLTIYLPRKDAIFTNIREV